VPNTDELKADTIDPPGVVSNTATAFSSFLRLPAAGSRNNRPTLECYLLSAGYGYLCKVFISP
jgi:hypothetical protein